MPMSRRRKLLFSLVPLVVLLGAYEVGARILERGRCVAPTPVPSDWREMQGDTDTLWSLVPNRPLDMGRGRAQVGPDGLRERDRATPKPPHEIRILTVGDSGVFGWSVPDGETWQERLQGKLSADFPGSTFRVVNFGVPGFSTVQSLRLLDRLGWAWQPDLVLDANLFSDCNIDVFQDEEALAVVDPDRNRVHRLLASSRLYCTLWTPWATWYAHRGQGRNRVLMPGVQGSTWLQERVGTYIQLSRVPLPDYEDNLETLRSRTVAHDAGFMLMILAQESDVGLWSAKHRPPPQAGEVLPWTPYRAAMRAFAEEKAIPLVSMPEAFAQAAKRISPDRLFADPVHPSSDGAAVMAEALEAYFKAHPETLGL